MTSAISAVARQVSASALSAKQKNGEVAGDFMELILAMLGISSQELGENEELFSQLSQELIEDSLAEEITKNPSEQMIMAVLELLLPNEAMASGFELPKETLEVVGASLEGKTASLEEIFQSLKSGKEISGEQREIFSDFLSKLEPKALGEIVKKAIIKSEEKLPIAEFKELKEEISLELPKETTLDFLEKKEMLLRLRSKFQEEKPKDEPELKDIKSYSIKEFMDKGLAQNSRLDKSSGIANADKPDRLNIVDQFRDGLISNMGRRRFTIRLKPEGIGDITVNMTKQADGKLSLSVLASNKELEMAIEENMTKLQASLKPLGAEVVPREQVQEPQKAQQELNQDQSQRQRRNQEQQSQKQEDGSDGEDFEEIKSYFEALSQARA